MKRKLALVLEYQGTRYHGFQLQVNATTIQGKLEQALFQLTGERSRMHGAGRTDSGAHALGQVVAFTTASPLPVRTFVSGLNAYLPQDIAVREAYRVGLEFDPRRNAISRVYRYTILNRAARSPAWEGWAYRVAEPLDVEAMAIALRSLEGSHDFAAFGGSVPAGKSTIRQVVDTRVWREEDRVLVEMEANAFLPGQVRRTVGELVRVGTGSLSPEAVRAMVERNSEQVARVAVPSEGLCLMQINYEDFPPDDDETNEDL